MSDFSTVAVGGLTATSTSESAESMISSLTPAKDESSVPREVKPDSKEPETEPETEEARVSKAASDLGKKGGEATAAKRAEAAKEAAKAEKDAEAASEAEKDAEAEKLGKPRHDAKARMLEATRQAAEAKRELERERAERVRERAQLAAEVEQLRAGKPAEQAKPAGKPTSEQYDSYEAFLDARDEWNDRQRETRDTERARFAARDQGIKTAFSTFTERVEEAKKTDASFMERTSWFGTQQPSFTLPRDEHGRPVGLRASHVLTDEIISSEQAPALMLHFAEHPEDLQRIEALRTPLDVQMAVSKLEGRLDAALTATAPRAEVSKARPPVRPVTGSPNTADRELDENAPLSAFVSRYGQRELSSRR